MWALGGNALKFVVIKRMGSLTMNVVMTARKVISALISIFVFNAELGQSGLIGCALVILAMSLEFQTPSKESIPKVDHSKHDEAKHVETKHVDDKPNAKTQTSSKHKKEK